MSDYSPSPLWKHIHASLNLKAERLDDVSYDVYIDEVKLDAIPPPKRSRYIRRALDGGKQIKIKNIVNSDGITVARELLVNPGEEIEDVVRSAVAKYKEEQARIEEEQARIKKTEKELHDEMVSTKSAPYAGTVILEDGGIFLRSDWVDPDKNSKIWIFYFIGDSYVLLVRDGQHVEEGQPLWREK